MTCSDLIRVERRNRDGSITPALLLPREFALLIEGDCPFADEETVPHHDRHLTIRDGWGCCSAGLGWRYPPREAPLTAGVP